MPASNGNIECFHVILRVSVRHREALGYRASQMRPDIRCRDSSAALQKDAIEAGDGREPNRRVGRVVVHVQRLVSETPRWHWK